MKGIWMAALLAAVAMAGCTDGGGKEFVTPPQDEQGRYVIEMTPSFKFVPENAVVPVGATVVWVNEGGAHNTEAEDGLWRTEVSGSEGEHFTFTFTQENAGDHPYFCKPHKSTGMTGTIRVE